jgi:glycosyltransferase involved in cell wall biosynthesis
MRGSAQPATWRGGLRRLAVRAARLLAFPDRQLTWYPGAVRLGRSLIERDRPDVIMASYGPGTSLLVAARLARGAGLPLVLDFRDLWSDLPLDVFATRWHRRAAAWLERRCVARAARVTCTSERMASHLAERHGRPPEDVIAIPNGFDPAWLDRPTPAPPRPDGPVRLVYAGAVRRPHRLEPFFRALRNGVDSGAITPASLEIAFVGNLDHALPQRFGLDDMVQCGGFVPHAEIAALLDGADALLLIEHPGYWGKFSYSAKVFDYAIIGKPVLALAEDDSNSAGLLRALGTGIIVGPDDERGILTALVELIREARSAPCTVNPSKPPLSQFDRRYLAGRLAATLADACRADQATPR